MTGHQVLWAAGLAGVAVGLWSGLRGRSRAAERARGLFGESASASSGVKAGGGAVLSRLRAVVLGDRLRWLVPELLLLPLGLVLGQMARSPVPLLVAAAGVLPLRKWRHRRRRAAEACRRETAVIELCAGLAAELRAGATADRALSVVTARLTSLRAGLGPGPTASLAAGQYGADIPAALRAMAELPGGRGAAAVAACWEVTAESGTGLAAGLDQLADALRAERALTEEIAGELAGPRATIVVLAALPLIGLLLGAALGAEPVRILLHTPVGLTCLAVGALLEAAGLAWTARIVRGAEDPGVSPDRGGSASHPGPPGERSMTRGAAGRGGTAAPGAASTREAMGSRRLAVECGISRTRPDRMEAAW
ncbi:type II secretion system F family protein [Kitasatospora sp. GP82]|uniref:type II secretion system F family protein n=1 Tax=Kitasatospora sp. GP82 TaxID=3035089 RepID=UPI0024770177|nr:type II secretion system F family protein [Kitasatospora sp. GP82]MDH6124569.1 tight adherence protein B [Kitasatospora sp. GP82]